MAFDIIKQDFSKSAQQGYEFELLLPEGTASGAYFTILGEMAPDVQNFIKRNVNEQIRKERLPKKNGREEIPTIEDIYEKNVEAALIRLISWRGIQENGKDVPFSKEKAAEIMAKHNWIAPQILEESNKVENFTPKTTKN
jgi:hypothetical protein